MGQLVYENVKSRIYIFSIQADVNFVPFIDVGTYDPVFLTVKSCDDRRLQDWFPYGVP